MNETAPQNFTPDEIAMLQKWRSLDRREQKTILLTVEHEYQAELRRRATPYLRPAPKE